LGEFAYGVCCLFGYNATQDLQGGAAYFAHLKTHAWRDLVFVGGLALLSAGDEKAAADHFRLAAEAESPVGQAYYGWVLENGVGGEQNGTEAAEWYRKAADNGYDHIEHSAQAEL
jgi:TPR repeat protein